MHSLPMVVVDGEIVERGRGTLEAIFFKLVGILFDLVSCKPKIYGAGSGNAPDSWTEDSDRG